jgi:hypothetical protein
MDSAYSLSRSQEPATKLNEFNPRPRMLLHGSVNTIICIDKSYTYKFATRFGFPAIIRDY